MATRTTRLSIAALTIDVQGGTELRILPAGEFRARDGRPKECPAWRLSAAGAERLIAQAAARHTRYVVDYEHQTLLAASNGQPAPAAGWFHALAWRADGLYATDVEWTERARAMIAAREYRYLSPVFSYDPATGEVLALLHVALTNTPALDELGEVVVAAARFLGESSPAECGAQPTQEACMPELLKKLLAALGLQETATEAEALGAVTALKTRADQVEGLSAQVAALKAAAPDPAKFVSVATMQELQGQVAALTARLQGQEVDTVIAEALQAGKLLPAQEAWARALGGKDIASLKSYLSSAPAIVPTQPQTQGRGVEDKGEAKLSAEETAVCKAMGIAPEAYAKTKAAAAA